MDIAYQGDIQKGFRFDPEVLASLTFSLGVGDQDGNELQDILFAVDVSKRILVHRFAEINGIESTHVIAGGH